MTDNAKDVLKSFSEDLVALCRKHQIGQVDCTVNLDSTANFLRSINFGWAQFRLTWREGRHGVRNTIEVKYESSMSFPEPIQEPLTAVQGVEEEGKRKDVK